MFDPSDQPRVYATPLGVDFSAELIAGLDEKLQGHPPHALAQVEIFIASDRMRRRIEALYAERRASFLPRLTPVGRIADRPDLAGLPMALSPLGLRLRLVTLISALLDQDATLAPRAALYDLADSLATLMAEMHEEGVTPEAIEALQTDELALHWTRNAAFLRIIARYFGVTDGPVPVEARQALAVERLAAIWARTPPRTPVIVAGSTGSRGATARLMAAVARLPQGAVILPGLDQDMPAEVWSDLLEGRRAEGLAGEDHPQFRLGRFVDAMGLAPEAIEPWTKARPAAPERNAWMSLALRPAPVTHAWLTEAPALPAAEAALADVTLLAAPTPREEAAAIALRLREAAETGQRATLVTPDRMLARAVTAALDRWGILPDDSAGLPLDMTNTGRLLALVADLMAGRGDAVEMLAVLKHPLTHSGAAHDQHLRWVASLELTVLRGGGLHPDRRALEHWVTKHGGDADWAAWVAESVLDARSTEAPLSDLVALHIARAEALAAGPGQGGSGALWDGEAGQTARERMRAVAAEAAHGGALQPRDYRDLITAILADTDLRNPVRPHAGVMIWGALEARVQGADLMILGGLNEGIWPAADAADPWLNRALRAQAGLRLPDRRTGLSAHDFQQAAAAPEVWLSRAVRDSQTETVPSRWLNRLTNLLSGSGAKAALDAMTARGDRYLAMAAALETPAAPVPRALRSAPAPPRSARPRSLSVTQIEKLVRDPFAIYAQKVLGLTPLEPLRPAADARLRGTILHAILRRFVEETRDGLPQDAEARLVAVARQELDTAADWPVARHLWLAAIAGAAAGFVARERDRRALAEPWRFEIRGEASFAPLGVTLRGTADRIDRLPDGRLAIYDYKSGTLPTEKVERMFNQQLRLEAAMAARGAFGEPADTARVAYLGLDVSGSHYPVDLTRAEIEETALRLTELWAQFLDDSHGFVPLRAMQKVNYDSDYQHLARYGEWDDADDPVVVVVGR